MRKAEGTKIWHKAGQERRDGNQRQGRKRSERLSLEILGLVEQKVTTRKQKVIELGEKQSSQHQPPAIPAQPGDER